MRDKVAELVGLLLSSWEVSGQLASLSEAYESTSQGYLASQVRSRTRKAFERIFKSNPVDVLEGIVEGWHTEKLCNNEVISCWKVYGPF